jgi:hypothetical protein
MRPVAGRRENEWVLASELHEVEHLAPGSRRCRLVVEGVAVLCRIVDVPRIGDRIHADQELTIESIGIRTDGMVELEAVPAGAVPSRRR